MPLKKFEINPEHEGKKLDTPYGIFVLSPSLSDEDAEKIARSGNQFIRLKKDQETEKSASKKS